MGFVNRSKKKMINKGTSDEENVYSSCVTEISFILSSIYSFASKLLLALTNER